MSLDTQRFTDKNPKVEVKNKEPNENLKFKMELELLSSGLKDETFLNTYLKTYHNINLNLLNNETKKKFFYELSSLFGELKGYKPGMEKDLKEFRETFSSGYETGKDEEHYKGLIISNKIGNRITILKEIIRINEGKELSEEDLKVKKILDKANSNAGFFVQGFGIDYLGTLKNNGYEELEKVYADKLLDVENMSVADLVICLRMFAPIISGVDDVKQSIAGISADGKIQGIGDRSFMFLTGMVGSTGVGGVLAFGLKGVKLAGSILKIEKIIEKLSKVSNLDKLAKDENFIKLLEMLKGKIKIAGELLEKLKPSKNILKISDEVISKLNDEDLIKFLYKNNIKQLDVSKLSSTQLTRLNNTLTQNFPLIEIFRITPGNKLNNINIGGIKQINDVAGQHFCDLVVLKFKELLKSNFEKANLTQNQKGRIVKSDYKNHTSLNNGNNAIEGLFGKMTTKEEVIEHILKSISSDIEKNARTILYEQQRKGEITISSPANFEELVKQKVIDTKEVVKTNFDFGVGEDIVGKSDDPIAKLDSMRKTEISSRPGGKKESLINLRKFDKAETIGNLKESLNLEKNIIEKFKGQKFIFEGTHYNVVTNHNGTLSLSTELLRYIRKYPEKIKPEELVKLIKSYINKLNNSLDFISPVRGTLKSNSEEFMKAKEIDKQFKAGIVDVKSLFHDFKGGLTKTAFSEITKGKAGIRGSIDIKDMGIDNLVDFNLRAKQIVKLEEDFKAGKIDIKVFEENQTKLFLESGKSVSDKFMEVQKRIQSKYPDALLRFGGDEIEFFIPTSKNIEVQGNMTSILNASNLKARMILDITSGVDDSKEAYSKLEKLTKLNKIIEETIEKQLVKKGLKLEGNVPNQTYVNMHNFIREKIMIPGFNLDEFFKKIKEITTNTDLIGTGKKDINLGEIQDGIKLSLVKKTNNEVEIYLHN